MEQTDPGKAERVWSRVLSAQSADTCLCAQEPGLRAEVLGELIGEAHSAWRRYRSLAHMTRRQTGKRLLHIAEEEKRRAGKLCVMYYLATGKKYCPTKPCPACAACFNEAIRQAYQQELDAAERFDALARSAGAHAGTLRQFAEQERAHARQLACILQTTL